MNNIEIEGYDNLVALKKFNGNFAVTYYAGVKYDPILERVEIYYPVLRDDVGSVPVLDKENLQELISEKIGQVITAIDATIKELEQVKEQLKIN